MIHVFGSHTGKEEQDAVKDSISNNWMGCGPKVAQFEDLFSKRLNRPFVLVNNGSNALHLAIKLLNLPKGSRIILPSFTFIACANAVLLEGHVPVFVDVELDGNISNRTINVDGEALMVVHYGGKPAEIKTDLPIIEDVAHAVDSKIGNVYCGALGKTSAFSFDPIKNLATPDLGGVACDDPDLAKSLRHCGLKSTGLQKSSSSGVWWEDELSDVFPKYMPNDVAASIALVQLDKLQSNQKRRKEIWDFYQYAFQSLNWLEIPQNTNHQHSYFTYLIRTKRRNELAKYLKENGVYTTLRFYPIHYTLKYNVKLPNTEILAEEGLNLPLHPRMTNDEVSKVINLVSNFR